MGLFSAGASLINTASTNASNEESVRQTNAANKAIADAANRTQKEIAEAQNALNYKMFNEQNQWNLDQWHRENEYNSPSAQVQRYIDAGINPIYGISGGNPGNAQQLTSAQAQPAAGYDVNVPRMDSAKAIPADLSGLTGVADSVINGLIGFQKLKIAQQDADTRSRQADSTIDLNSTQANYYNSLAEGVNLNNLFNQETFGTRVNQLQKNVDKLQSEINVLDKDNEHYHTKVDLMDSQINLNKAMVTKSVADIQQTIASIRQRDREIAIMQQNADTAVLNAQTNAGTLDLHQRQYNLEVSRYKNDLRNKTNEQILSYINSSKGYFQKLVGTLTPGQEISFGPFKAFKTTGRNYLAELEAAGMVLADRYNSEPSDKNLDAYLQVYEIVNSIPLPSAPSAKPSTYSVQNPSDPWQ